MLYITKHSYTCFWRATLVFKIYTPNFRSELLSVRLLGQRPALAAFSFIALCYCLNKRHSSPSIKSEAILFYQSDASISYGSV